MGSKKRFCSPFKVNDNGDWSLVLSNKDSTDTRARQMKGFANALIGKIIDLMNDDYSMRCDDICNWKMTTERIVPLINHINSSKINIVFYPWTGDQCENRISATINIDNKTNPKADIWTWDGNYCVDAKYYGNLNSTSDDDNSEKKVYEFDFDEFRKFLRDVCCNKNDTDISKNDDILSQEEINSLLNYLDDDGKNINNKIHRHNIKDDDSSKKKIRNVRKPKAYDHLTKQVFDTSSNRESGNCKKIAIKNIIKAICSNYFSKPHYYINFNSITWTNDSDTNTNEYSVLVKYHRKTFKINISLEEAHDGSQVVYLFWGRYVISKLNPTTQKWNVIKYDTLPLKGDVKHRDENTDSSKPKNKIKPQGKSKNNKSDLPDIDSLSNDLLDLTEKFETINNKINALADKIYNSLHR